MLFRSWEIVVRIRDIEAWLLPSPSLIARTLVDERQLLLDNTWVTLSEVLLGFGLAVVVGVTAGILNNLRERLYPEAEPGDADRAAR